VQAGRVGGQPHAEVLRRIDELAPAGAAAGAPLL
jgi:hypothetical protein